ncbi:NYN domain-containing protein [Microbacterium arborescens]|uniref:NYN domain-containing protein n=1 Tax=Microbacterium arborescens TaxID=33883 RepID=UPI000DF80D13|nr:NYN domain-containing protein [Microbacterium arborescens]
MPQQSDLLAVLVDADNVSPSRIGGVLAEIATYGTASVKRVYGDWTKSQLRGWKDAASEHVIQPMQQFDNTTGKNATDSALIIDAMDLLYTRRFQGFCIVSSDSDFTRLASRIREEGVTVYGFGERKTPEAFRNACDQFTYLEVLGVVDEKDAARSTTAERWTSAALRGDARLVALLRSAVETASADDGWSDLGTVGQLMRKQQPDFDPRNWGYAKLSDLVRAVGLFTIESKPGGMSLRPKDAAGVKGSDDTPADASAKGRGDARGEAEAGTTGGRSRRKPSRAKNAAQDTEPPAPEVAAEARDVDSPATPPAEPTSGSTPRNRRPMIEQLTLGAALDAALDAVSSAARGNAAASAAPSESTETAAGVATIEPAPASDATETSDVASTDEPAVSADAAPVTDEAPAAGRAGKKTGGRTAAKTSAKSEAETTSASGESKTRTSRKTGARTAAKRATDARASTETQTDEAAPAPSTDAASAPAADVDPVAESVPAETEPSSDAPVRPKRASRSRAAAPKTPSNEAEAEAEAPTRPKRAPRSRKAPVTDAPAEPAAEPRAEEPAAAAAPVKRTPRRASRPGSSAS